MKELLLATSNKNKIEEIKEILKGSPFSFTSLIDYPELILPEETGTTFEENALLKARVANQLTGSFSLADDSGLVVLALDGRPGIFSARYAGLSSSDAENRAKLLSEMRGIDRQERRAYFYSAIALIGDGVEEVVSGSVYGIITEEEKGHFGFGYDALFIPDGYDKTFAELGALVKHEISHRAIALRKMKAVIENRFGHL